MHWMEERTGLRISIFCKCFCSKVWVHIFLKKTLSKPRFSKCNRGALNSSMQSISYLRTGCEILLLGMLLPLMANGGLGRALRPTIPALAILFGIGIPVLECNCKLLDTGILLLPCTVGLTYAVAFRGCLTDTGKCPTLWTLCCSCPGDGTAKRGREKN